MNIPDLNKATQLYEILGKYVPVIPNENYLDYINAIFENIKEDGNYRAYFDAIQLMTGKDYDELTRQEPIDVLEIFIQSLIEWKIIELIAFYRNVGYGNDRSS
jgi:hypothetical protein